MCTQIYTYIRIDIFYNITPYIHIYIAVKQCMCVPLVRARRDITTHFSRCNAEELKRLLHVNIIVENSFTLRNNIDHLYNAIHRYKYYVYINIISAIYCINNTDHAEAALAK